MPKIKNIIIFIAIGTVFVLIYIFFIKPAPNDAATLISSGGAPVVSNTVVGNMNEAIAQDFLSLLLNVKNIKLDDAIFSDVAFISLDDSNSITLIPDGTEGRINPFAQFGNDIATILPPTCTLPKVLDIATNACVTSPLTCTLPKVLNTETNTCVTPIVCTLPKVLNTSTNACVTPVTCTLPQVRNIDTNTCVNPSLN